MGSSRRAQGRRWAELRGPRRAQRAELGGRPWPRAGDEGADKWGFPVGFRWVSGGFPAGFLGLSGGVLVGCSLVSGCSCARGFLVFGVLLIF